jgi:hypothetical protein
MAEFPNPPIITGPAPTDGQIAAYQASTNSWVAVNQSGAQGATGAQGAQGATGAQGAQGAQGATG